jgi:hypothetical protein
MVITDWLGDKRGGSLQNQLPKRHVTCSEKWLRANTTKYSRKACHWIHWEKAEFIHADEHNFIRQLKGSVFFRETGSVTSQQSLRLYCCCQLPQMLRSAVVPKSHNWHSTKGAYSATKTYLSTTKPMSPWHYIKCLQQRHTHTHISNMAVTSRAQRLLSCFKDLFLEICCYYFVVFLYFCEYIYFFNIDSLHV